MIPPVPEALFENKTVLGTGCDSCKKLQAEVKRLEKENNHLLDTCLAAGFIGHGTQIIGDKRYKELVKAETKIKRLEKVLEQIVKEGRRETDEDRDKSSMGLIDFILKKLVNITLWAEQALKGK